MEFTFSNIAYFALIFFCLYVSIYSIIDRICTCFENRAISKSFEKFVNNIEEKKDGEEEKE